MKGKILLGMLLSIFIIALVSAAPTVTLISPADNYIVPVTNQISFSSSFSSSKNASLWTNITGSWAINQSTSVNLYSNETSGSAITNFFGGVTTKFGAKIYMINDANLSNGTKINSGADHAYIYDSNMNLLKTVTGITNGFVNFDNYPLLSGHIYYILDDSGGASENHYYGLATWNITGSNIKWIYGYANGGESNNMWDWINLEFINASLNSQSYTINTNKGFVWNIQSCDITGSCAFASANRTVLVNPITSASATFNPTTAETNSETFILNATADGLQTISATLNYAGTSYTTTNVGTNTSASFTRTLDIPLGVTNNTFNWTINYGAISVNTINYGQYANASILYLCNTTLNVPYLNLTFKDELTSAFINGAINPLTVQYYMGSGTVYKSLTFTNSSYNPSYAFCFTPSAATLLNNGFTVKYSASGYPQRQYYFLSSLTNTTTNKLLYLLDSGSGIYTTFQVTTSNGIPISGVDVNVQLQISGVWTTIMIGTTDSAGTVTFWVDPNTIYNFNFVKSGCTSATSSLAPTQASYTQPMSCGAGISPVADSSQLAGIKYLRSPASGVTSPGSTNFSFYVYSNNYTLVKVKQEIVDSYSTILASSETVCTSTSSCSNSLIYSAISGSDLKGRYYVDINNGQGYILLEADAHWRFIAVNSSTFGTFKDFFEQLKYGFNSWGGEDYACSAHNTNVTCVADSNCKWVLDGTGYCIPKDNANQVEYSKFVLIFLFMAIVLAAMNKFTSFDSAYPGMATIMMGLLIIFGSVTGGLSCANQSCQGIFYYDGIFNGSNAASGFLNNYILALICILFMVGYYFSTQRRYT